MTKIFRSKPSKILTNMKLKWLVNCYPRYKKLILNAYKATNLPRLISYYKRLKAPKMKKKNFFKSPKLRSSTFQNTNNIKISKKTQKKSKKNVKNKMLPQLMPPLKLMQTPLIKSHNILRTLSKLLVTIIIKKTVLPINTLNYQNQKTSISFGNFYIGNWYW